MQSEGILQIVAKKCASLPKVEGPLDEAQRHHIVQQVMVNDVYLGGDPPFIEDFGFGKGEKGYVRMQMSMADHQNDPLVAQYIGSGQSRPYLLVSNHTKNRLFIAVKERLHSCPTVYFYMLT